MADFTIFLPAKSGVTLTERTPFYQSDEAIFMGFDELDARAECTEASLPDHLGLPMGAVSKAIFARMSPGTRKVVEGRVYARN